MWFDSNLRAIISFPKIYNLYLTIINLQTEQNTPRPYLRSGQIPPQHQRLEQQLHGRECTHRPETSPQTGPPARSALPWIQGPEGQVVPQSDRKTSLNYKSGSLCLNCLYNVVYVFILKFPSGILTFWYIQGIACLCEWPPTEILDSEPQAKLPWYITFHMCCYNLLLEELSTLVQRPWMGTLGSF